MLLLGKIPCRDSGGFDPSKRPFHFLLNLHGSQCDIPPDRPLGIKQLFPHLMGVLSEGGPQRSVLFGECLELKETVLSRSCLLPGGPASSG